MRKSLLLLSGILLVFPLCAQVIQKGVVVELNSGNKPVQGVEILTMGAVPTISNNDGAFELHLSAAETGDLLLITRIYKKGYEVVNEFEVKTRSISSSVPLRIIVCKAGVLEEARRKYYQIGEDLYFKRYKELVSDLKREQQKGELNKMEYEERIGKYKEELHGSISKLYYYANQFARINRDELSEIDVRAMALLEEGKVNEAIEVYEKSGLVDEFYEKVGRYLTE